MAEFDYKKLLEKAQKEYKQCSTDAERRMLESIFPELVESDDERIRKNCIHFLNLQKQHHASTFEIDECIAWLEKVKPKFKVSDWNVNGVRNLTPNIL